MSIAEFGRIYGPAITALMAAVNTVVLFLLIFRHRADIRKQRLEQEKLGLENEKASGTSTIPPALLGTGP